MAAAAFTFFLIVIAQVASAGAAADRPVPGRVPSSKCETAATGAAATRAQLIASLAEYYTDVTEIADPRAKRLAYIDFLRKWRQVEREVGGSITEELRAKIPGLIAASAAEAQHTLEAEQKIRVEQEEEILKWTRSRSYMLLPRDYFEFLDNENLISLKEQFEVKPGNYTKTVIDLDIVNTTTGKSTRLITADAGRQAPLEAAITRDRSQVVYPYQDKILIFDLKGKTTREVPFQKILNKISYAQFSRDEKLLFLVSTKGELLIYDFPSMNLRLFKRQNPNAQPPQNSTIRLDVDPQGRYAMLLGHQIQPVLIRLDTMETLPEIKTNFKSFIALAQAAFHPTEDRIFLTDNFGNGFEYKIGTGEFTKSQTIPKAKVLKQTPDGKKLIAFVSRITADHSSQIHIHDLETGQTMSTTADFGIARFLDMSEDGQAVVFDNIPGVQGGGTMIYILNTNDGTVIEAARPVIPYRTKLSPNKDFLFFNAPTEHTCYKVY